MTHTPSPYQVALLDQFQGTDQNLAVIARAGCGKSYMIEQMVRSLPERRHASTVVTSFSKGPVEHLVKKLPEQVKVKGLHSLGLGALVSAYQPDKRFGKKYVVEGKYDYILSDLIKPLGLPWKEASAVERAGSGLLSAIFNEDADYQDTEVVLSLLDKYEVDLEHMVLSIDDLQEMVGDALRRGKRELHRWASFDDMIHWPRKEDLPIRRPELCFVDEAQDMSPGQREHLYWVTQGSRVVLVGDPNQCVYTFAGAYHTLMQEMTAKLQAKVLPLPICYRCPTSHVKMARVLVPDIEAAPGAKEGTIDTVKLPNLIHEFDWKPGDMALCRVNKNLVEMAWALMRRKIPTFIRGKSIGLDLALTVDRATEGNKLPFDQLDKVLAAYRVKKVTSFAAREGNDMALEAMNDRIESLQVLFYQAREEGCLDLKAFKGKVLDLFDDKPAEGRVELGTIHKMKGREARRVVLLYPEKIPHKLAKRPDDLQAEKNLKYVALTRSMETYIFSETGPQTNKYDDPFE